MISIDGIALSDDLVWENEFDTPRVPQHIVPTLGNLAVVQELGVTNKQQITLAATQDGDDLYGFFTRSQVQQLKALEGTEVVFIYENVPLTVRIAVGGVQVRPRLARANQAQTDLYIGTITMTEV